MMHHIRQFILAIIDKIQWTLLQLKGFAIFGRSVGILGNFKVVNPANVRIGARCGINHGVFILGHSDIRIGNEVVLSAGVRLIDAGLDINNFMYENKPGHVSGEICIEDVVWIGAGAIVLPGVTIGQKSVTGAGSVVTKDVPPFSVVAGNPARIIRLLDV